MTINNCRLRYDPLIIRRCVLAGRATLIYILTVSKHLKLLEDAGLVDRKKEGLWVNYSLTGGSRSPYAASLLGNLKHWLAGDPVIRELLEKSETIRREDLCGTHN